MAKKRSLTGEMNIMTEVQGLVKSMANVKNFGRAIEQLSGIHKATTKRSEEFDWASQQLGKTHGKLQQETLQMNYLYRSYEKELLATSEGTKRASSLTNDQIDVFKELYKTTNAILRSDKKRAQLSKATIENIERQREAAGKATNEIAKMQEVEDKLTIASKFMGEAWADSFGQLQTGSKEADKVLGIFGNAFKRIAPTLKPILDQAKRMASDVFAEKIGLKVDHSDFTSALERMKEDFKKVPTAFEEHLSQPGGPELALQEPGRSTGDLGKATQAVSELEDSGTGLTKTADGIDAAILKAEAGTAGMTDIAASASNGMAGMSNAAASAGSGMADMAGDALSAGTNVADMAGDVLNAGKGMLATEGAAGGAAAGMAGMGAAAAAALGPVVILAAAQAVLTIGLQLLAEGFRMNIEEMQRYRRAGFRASGSIRELINTTGDLSISLGASSEQAIETVEAISQAGFAVKSLGEVVKTSNGEVIKGQAAILKLAETNLKFADATGASTKETAALQKRLNVMGKTAEDQEAILGALTQATEKYGLTGDEVTSMVQGLRKNSLLLETVWTDTNAYEYTRAMGTLSGAVKQLGLDAGVTSEIMNDLANATDDALKLAKMGGGLSAFFGNDQVAQMEAMGAGAKRILENAERMSGLKRIKYLEAFGGVEKLTALKKAQDILDAMSKEERASHDAKVASQAALDKGYKKSTDTFSIAWQKATAPMLQMWKKFAGPAIDAITSIINYLTPVMSEMATAFGTLWDGIMDAVKPFMPILKVIGKLLWVMIIAPFYAAMNIIKGLGVALSVLGAIFEFVFSPFILIFDAMDMALDKVIGAFSTIGSGIDSVIDSFYELIAPVREWITALGDAKNFMFGSSFLHVGEGIAEIMPFIDGIGSAFEAVMSPLKLVKDGMGAAFDMAKDFGSGVVDSVSSFLGFDNDEPQEAMEKSSTAKSALTNTEVEPTQPMSVYTVKFSDDLMTNEAENKSVSTSSMVEIAKLMRMMVEKDSDENNAKTAEILERMEKTMGDTTTKKEKPQITGSMRVSGEKLNKWW